MRQREEQDLSAEALRELEALDRALAGEGVDRDLEGFETLVRELRAARPEPPAGFAAELDERAAGGFAKVASPSKTDRLRAWLAGVRPMQILAPAGAIATIAIVVSVAVIRSDGGGPARDATTAAKPAGVPADGAGSVAAEPMQAQAEDPGRQSEAYSAGSGAMEGESDAELPGSVVDPARPRLAPGQSDRAIESSASIGLSTEADEFDDVADGVVEVTDRYDGLVTNSNETTSGETSRATFDLAIPADRLQDALADLSDLAHVESRSETSEDITAPTVSARANLTDARTEVDSLLRQLAEADTPAETREIRARLDIARAQVSDARDDLRGLERRADFATVSVAVTTNGSGDGDWGVDEALDDVGDLLSTVAGVILVSLALLVPIVLVLALVALAYRLVIRRGRERALDGPSD